MPSVDQSSSWWTLPPLMNRSSTLLDSADTKMTSFLQVIASDENEKSRLARRAAVLSKTRIDNKFGTFIEANGDSALEYLEEEIKTVVEAACEEVGYDDVEGTLATVVEATKPPQFVKNDTDEEDEEEDEDEEEGGVRQASTRESRKPKMCPFHKDVVEISLAAGDPRAGFDSMAQHWGGPRHCDGEGYEGGKCNFKAPMTTQAFWDEKAEKAEQKRQERLEQQADETVVTPITDAAPEATEDVAPVEDIATEPQGAEIIDFPSEPSAVGEGYEHAEPLAVAASTKVADGNTDLGGPSPKIDKRKWTPKTVKELPLEGDESRHPTERTDVAAQGYDNSGDLTSIGENKTEREALPSETENAGFQDGGETGDGQGGTWTKGPATAVASTHDVEKNELVEIMKSNYDGFLPQIEVQKAVVAHRSS